MIDKEACIAEIKETVNYLHGVTLWECDAFLEAMKHGLHGSKRENRFESVVDTNIKKFIQSEAMDIFGVAVHPEPTDKAFPKTKEPLFFLKEYLAGLWEIYGKLHGCANKFVSPLCLRHLAKPLYERAECVMKAIVRTKRMIDRYEAVSAHGTAMHDLYRQDCADESTHDDFEVKENKFGYEY